MCSRMKPSPRMRRCKLQNPRGDVTITASADDKMHLRAHQVVHSSSDKDVRNSLKR